MLTAHCRPRMRGKTLEVNRRFRSCLVLFPQRGCDVSLCLSGSSVRFTTSRKRMEIEEQRSRIAFRAHLITHSVERKEGRKQQNPHENDDDKKKREREA